VTAPHPSARQLAEGLAERGYLVDTGLATVLSVALSVGKPLLLEGEAGVGKTECAKALAELLGARLIRLQCYEGIDVSHALYDWNYARQMLYIRTLRQPTRPRPRPSPTCSGLSSSSAGRCWTRSTATIPARRSC
jgi:MoxR-like ATPase